MTENPAAEALGAPRASSSLADFESWWSHRQGAQFRVFAVFAAQAPALTGTAAGDPVRQAGLLERIWRHAHRVSVPGP